VPRGTDRIRTQMSAALEIEDLEFAIEAFTEVGKHLKII
jgi:7-keto-8-aminopelargonate synthetase-like enzyme